MPNAVYMGIDTSNYTTSVTVIDHSAAILEDKRVLLHVNRNEQGLRQSEALFQHVKNLPAAFESMQSVGKGAAKVEAIGVSVKPRALADSYMPVFLPGHGTARVLAAILQVRLVETTHQEGHLWAAMHSAGGPAASEFAALHVSGGTTDVIAVKRQGEHLHCRCVAGSADLHAGQFVDRVGVKLGLPFPAGPALEDIARGGGGAFRLSSSVTAGSISFSGPCSAALRAVEKGTEKPEDVALAVFLCIARSLEKALRWHTGCEGCVSDVLLSGGVMANAIIREELSRRLPFLHFHSASPRYSVDNGLGPAVAAWAQSNKDRWENQLFR